MIIEEIRARTSENHILLENSGLLSAFGRRSIDKPTYYQILQLFYGYFLPLEKRVDSILGLTDYLPDYAQRRKAEWLRQDIQQLESSLGVKVPPSFCTDLPEISSIAQAFGCLYVMEGSTLGGKFISGVVRQCLGIDASSGAAFFNGYGEETGKRWKTFQQALRHFSEQTGEDDLIIQTANQTFQKMQQWVSSHSAHSNSQ